MLRSSLCLALCLASSLAHADEPACQPAPASVKLALPFNRETTIGEFATWISTTTCKAVVYDAGVGRDRLKATIVAPNRYTPKDALQLVLDAIQTTGLVVEQKPESFTIKLGPNMPKCPDVVVAPQTVPDETEQAFDDGIKKIDDTSRTISRALFDKLGADPKPFLKGARLVPAMKNGKPEGIKLYAIRPTSIFAKLGLSNGDTVHKVNGVDLLSVEDAIKIAEKLKADKKLAKVAVDITRRGKPVTLTFTIVK
jgi:hypothetical protein